MKDYYRILGVKPSAAPVEIKKAYRVLAFRHHPDKNPEDPASESKFKELQEAYATLSNAERRTRYDDERWVAGLGGNTRRTEPVTPQWLLHTCVQLTASLAKMDAHSISNGALKAYILLIVSDEHIALLREHADKEMDQAIIHEIIKATKKLHPAYLEEITRKLLALAGDNEKAKEDIFLNEELRMRKYRQEKMLPYFVILVTLILCMLMYFFGGLNKPSKK